jgi:heme-degrading monooxygenase HmoA
MFAVIFEVEPRTGMTERYLQLAERLRPELENIEGFVGVERFASRSRKGWVLSLSIWRDEEALGRWRMQGRHRAAQEQGRASIFSDYRLRIGEITEHSKTGAARFVTITELSAAAAKSSSDRDGVEPLGLPATGTQGVVDREWFESITSAGKRLLLVGWRDRAAAERWQLPQIAELHHRCVRIIRDYGMFDRAEAPQYYPPASRTV